MEIWPGVLIPFFPDTDYSPLHSPRYAIDGVLFPWTMTTSQRIDQAGHGKNGRAVEAGFVFLFGSAFGVGIWFKGRAPGREGGCGSGKGMCGRSYFSYWFIKEALPSFFLLFFQDLELWMAPAGRHAWKIMAVVPPSSMRLRRCFFCSPFRFPVYYFTCCVVLVFLRNRVGSGRQMKIPYVQDYIQYSSALLKHMQSSPLRPLQWR